MSQSPTSLTLKENFLALDPGNKETAFVEYDPQRKLVLQCGILPNGEVLEMLRPCLQAEHVGQPLAIEAIASYGMPVGAEVFDTCIWIGRFYEAWKGDVHLIKRMEVKMHLCHTTRAKDGNVRQALLDRWGGKEAAIGKKASPGALYRVKSHCWSALAVAVTFAERSNVV